jgi:zinc protease
VSLDALTGDRLGPSLDLLAEVALHPRFDKADFTRVRQEVVDGIAAARADPNDVARRAFAAQLWGDTHPYGVPAVGTEAAVGAIQLKDVQSWYKLWWHAGNAAIVVSGDVEPGSIQAALEQRFSAWKKGKAVRPPVLAPAPPVATRVVFVEQPGAVQTVLLVGTSAMPRRASEYPAANVAGTLLGGMFSSRLNINLREEHGWSYGAYGGFSESRDYGTFSARTSVQADKTAPAVQEIFKELGAAAGRAPTADELTMTRDYLLKSLPGNFETNGAAADAFAATWTLGLQPDAWRSFVTDTRAVTAEQAGAAAKKYFDDKRMLVVAVGPRTVTVDGKTTDVVAELKALGHEYVEWTR